MLYNTAETAARDKAEAAALAVLDVRVHLDLAWTLPPNDDVLPQIDLGSLSIETPAATHDTVVFGDDWLASMRTPLLRVGSVIVPESANILVNPRHPASGDIKIVSSRPFAFDLRLWRPGAS